MTNPKLEKLKDRVNDKISENPMRKNPIIHVTEAELNALMSVIELYEKAMINNIKNNDCDCGHEEGNGLCFLHQALTEGRRLIGEI